MKMMKVFKKIIAVVFVATLINIGATTEKAEAASCPPHDNYYNHEVGGRPVGYVHTVTEAVYGLTESGKWVQIGTYSYSCTVTFNEVYVEVRCGKCHKTMSTYWYSTDEKHSESHGVG